MNLNECIIITLSTQEEFRELTVVRPSVWSFSLSAMKYTQYISFNLIIIYNLLMQTFETQLELQQNK